MQSDEFDSDPPYSPSFLSSTDSDMNFEDSNDENNDKNNEGASPVIPYIKDLHFPDPSTSEADSMSNIKESETTGHPETSTTAPETPTTASQILYLQKLKKKKRKTILCKFCENYVTNFERHIERNHSSENEVKEFLSYPKKSHERKQILQVLKNDANFKEFLKGNVMPYYRPKEDEAVSLTEADYAPCIYCKQIVSASYIKKHGKKCAVKALCDEGDTMKGSFLAASHTLIGCSMDASGTINKLRVKRDVLNKMAPDNISLTAKTDNLILAFGEDYLKKHKRIQMATPCSNKMRELARLLIEIRRRLKTKCQLEAVLRPEYYQIFLESVRTVCGYNELTRTFGKSASLADHYGTSIKQVCDVLMTLLMTKSPLVTRYDSAETQVVLKEIKQFQSLIVKNWSNEIGSLARKDLGDKRRKKQTVLPLTDDINKFRQHCLNIIASSISDLKANNENTTAFRELTEAILAFIILFNRKRIGDVQYMTVAEYRTDTSTVNQQECLEALTESERQLTKFYKRVVTAGKLSRSVVILIPQNMEKHLDFMIEIRNRLVPPQNPYLFAYPGVADRWIKADIVIRKIAKATPNISNPASISGNKLRKQISTVLQILNMNKEESEQFAKFLGHTEKTHSEFYK